MKKFILPIAGLILATIILFPAALISQSESNNHELASIDIQRAPVLDLLTYNVNIENKTIAKSEVKSTENVKRIEKSPIAVSGTNKITSSALVVTANDIHSQNAYKNTTIKNKSTDISYFVIDLRDKKGNSDEVWLSSASDNR